MSKYDLVLTNDIDTKNVYFYLDNVLKNGRTLFLTATQSLKRIRLSKGNLENISNITNKLQTFSELKEEILSNLNEHFEEHISEGKGENQAYTEALGDLGDIDDSAKFFICAGKGESRFFVFDYTNEELSISRGCCCCWECGSFF